MTLQESALSIQALFPQMNTVDVNSGLLPLTVCCSAFTDWRSDECQNQYWCAGEFLLKNLVIALCSILYKIIKFLRFGRILVMRRIVFKDM